MKKIIFVLLVIILISGCKPQKFFSGNKDYFSQNKLDYLKYKNPNLTYEWDFNETINNGGGKTYRKDYFHIKKYNLIDKLTTYLLPYLVIFKHEEGHIFAWNLWNFSKIDNFDTFIYDPKCKKKFGETSRNYSIIISEGTSEYYAIKYFDNFNLSLGKEYFSYSRDNRHYNDQYWKNYIGYLFVNHTISRGEYKDLNEFILNWCTEKQYNLFQEFIKSLT